MGMTFGRKALSWQDSLRPFAVFATAKTRLRVFGNAMAMERSNCVKKGVKFLSVVRSVEYIS